MMVADFNGSEAEELRRAVSYHARTNEWKRSWPNCGAA
jgi:hypothetical protein